MQLRVGTVKSYDAGTHTAGVQLDISPVYMAGVPVSRGIGAGEMVVDRACVIVFSDPTDNVDAMVLGVY